MVSIALNKFFVFAKGSPIPIKTTELTFFVIALININSASISSAVKFLESPIAPVEQKAQEYPQPT